MASTESEPITWVWGGTPAGPGAQLSVGDQGAWAKPLKLNPFFCILRVQGKPQICPITEKGERNVHV